MTLDASQIDKNTPGEDIVQTMSEMINDVIMNTDGIVRLCHIVVRQHFERNGWAMPFGDALVEALEEDSIEYAMYYTLQVEVMAKAMGKAIAGLTTYPAPSQPAPKMDGVDVNDVLRGLARVLRSVE
jgi:hypothetical protein